MNQGIVSLILYTASLILFAQSIWIGLVQIIRRQGLEPPIAPSIDETSNNESPISNSHYNETQLTISRAIHPHLYHHSSSRPPTSTSKTRLTTSCSSSNSTSLCRINNSRLYKQTVPYLSTYMLLIQALIGLSFLLITVTWHANGSDGCKLPGQMSLVGFYVGFAMLFLASAVQTHLVNDRCIKIFFIIGLGIATHFVMLAMVITNNIAKYSMDEICLVDIDQPLFGWLGNLPTYSAVAYFFMSFFSFVSFINGSSRLCTRSRFLSLRELSFVMAVYRGIGLLFTFGLIGALFNALGVAMAALKIFHFAPLWLFQWAVLSRIMAAALWHRAHSDVMAHVHPFWSSDRYLAWHPVAEQNAKSRKPSGFQAILAVLHIILHGDRDRDLHKEACEEKAIGRKRANAGMRMRARSRTVVIGRDCVDNGIGPSDMHDRSSRHETVVADIVHCSSCTCDVFFE